MTEQEKRIRSVAIIGAGASGAVTAAALAAEEYFERIQVFERRECAGGTWIYDGDPNPLPLVPGGLPPATDPALEIPSQLPKITSPNRQERYHKTPIYDSLTTNVPSIAMVLSDIPFPYGPFVPHHIPRQYIESYFCHHRLDSPSNLCLNTTVENLSFVPAVSDAGPGQDSDPDPKKPRDGGWKLTLRKYDVLRKVDIWWEEHFDAVVLANGHYSVPYIPQVPGLKEYMQTHPDRVSHSKTYRSPTIYQNKRVLVIGNSASGHDTTLDLLRTAHLPVHQSRRSPSRWDGAHPPENISWHPPISIIDPSRNRITFQDGTSLDGIDHIIYCTGYLPSYPFWDVARNGRAFYDYERGKVVRIYQHTFVRDFSTLAIVGLPHVLSFRGFEYQAIAVARLFSGRAGRALPGWGEQVRWERERMRDVWERGRKFHDINWEEGETREWMGWLFGFAGLGGLFGEGRDPPRLGGEVRWAVEHLRKYPEPGKSGPGEEVVVGGLNIFGERGEEGDYAGEVLGEEVEGNREDWVVVNREKKVKKDLLHFI